MLRLTAAVLFGALVAGPVAAAPVPAGPKDKVLGKWKLVATSAQSGLAENSTFYAEFKPDGKVEFRTVPDGKEYADAKPVKGTWKMVGDDKIDYTQDFGDGNVKQEVLKVRKLTDDELVVTDPDDVKEEFKRVKDDKKKDGEKKKKEKKDDD